MYAPPRDWAFPEDLGRTGEGVGEEGGRTDRTLVAAGGDVGDRWPEPLASGGGDVGMLSAIGSVEALANGSSSMRNCEGEPLRVFGEVFAFVVMSVEALGRLGAE